MTPVVPEMPEPQPRPPEPRSFESWTERAADYHARRHPANAPRQHATPPHAPA